MIKETCMENDAEKSLCLAKDILRDQKKVLDNEKIYIETVDWHLGVLETALSNVRGENKVLTDKLRNRTAGRLILGAMALTAAGFGYTAIWASKVSTTLEHRPIRAIYADVNSDSLNDIVTYSGTGTPRVFIQEEITALPQALPQGMSPIVYTPLEEFKAKLVTTNESQVGDLESTVYTNVQRLQETTK